MYQLTTCIRTSKKLQMLKAWKKNLMMKIWYVFQICAHHFIFAELHVAPDPGSLEDAQNQDEEEEDQADRGSGGSGGGGDDDGGGGDDDGGGGGAAEEMDMKRT